MITSSIPSPLPQKTNENEPRLQWISINPKLPDEVKGRSQKCLQTFQRKYGADNLPQFLIRVPGRVNLIGEHIDYCGYGVFPMAIDQDVLVCLGIIPSSLGVLYLTNSNSIYDDYEIEFRNIKNVLESRVIGTRPQWYMYFLAGIQGILDEITEIPESLPSLLVSIDGRIPPSAGLSSSSAIVCGAALACLKGRNIDMDREQVASLCAKSERFVGTEGGGMDQAIAMLATSGTAQFIEFIPFLKGEKVQLPSDAIFVVANSLAEANKAASDAFNIRVAEGRLATWVLGKKSGLTNDWATLTRVRDLELVLGLNYSTILDLLEKCIHPHAYTSTEIGEILGLEINELSLKPLLSRIPFEKIMEFHLYNRLKHVIQEADRVTKFREACLNGNLNIMGHLMTQSHNSLRDLYDCSHPLLDQLIDISNGLTYGARLTGAGWGGCMVALTDQSKLDIYLDTLLTKFYTPVHGITQLSPSQVFVTQPGSGALIYLL